MPKENIEKSLQELIDEADDLYAHFTRRKESRPLYEEALKIAQEAKKELETEYIQGKLDLVDEKWEDALQHFDRVIKRNPQFFKAWNYKGASLDALARYEEALACYDKALEINPRYEDAWYNKGCVLDDLERYEEALACYDKALEINSRNEEAWYNKGCALSDLGRYEEALACYDKALEIDPNDPDIWNNKGVTLTKLGRYKEAITCYDKALELNPLDEDAKSNRNLALMQLGKVEEALEGRKELSSEKKEGIEKSKLSTEEKKEKILELEAREAVINELRGKYKELLDAKKAYEKRLADSLKPRDEPLNENFFLVLRRWNSYTPRMLTPTESNLGGGYFLCWKGKGIVVDPGFDFIDNFFNNDLLIDDIDAVVITHAHVDHCSDFESLLTLLFEYNEKNKHKKKIDVFMNLGAMKKFLGWISINGDEKDAMINRLYSLEEGNTYDFGDSIRIRATKAIHDEVLCKAYSVGLIFELDGEKGYTKTDPFRIGYTSDTRHDKDVEEQYEGVDVIVPHLGSIDENDFGIGGDTAKRDENHLMLTGVISTIYKSNAKLAIISEFGEELGEERVTIVGALNRVFRKNNMARCLTGDIGLKVQIPELTVKCHYCDEYANAKEVLEAIDPENEPKKCLIYYCKKCKGTHDYECKK
ncbi:MAG TPA: tetratricopeptide repeat protein [Desulfobacteria bacterium]|nr:tetratricopeptide repeat protein [Desulfobacteria bacterium]